MHTNPVINSFLDGNKSVWEELPRCNRGGAASVSPLPPMGLFSLGAFLAVKIHSVDLWVDSLERVGVLDSVFKSLYWNNQFSGFTEIGTDLIGLNVPKSHLQAEQFKESHTS